eukprot:scaffold30223_cov94-Amphora_coffeaeformis.AAC.1
MQAAQPLTRRRPARQSPDLEVIKIPDDTPPKVFPTEKDIVHNDTKDDDLHSKNQHEVMQNSPSKNDQLIQGTEPKLGMETRISETKNVESSGGLFQSIASTDHPDNTTNNKKEGANVQWNSSHSTVPTEQSLGDISNEDLVHENTAATKEEAHHSVSIACSATERTTQSNIEKSLSNAEKKSTETNTKELPSRMLPNDCDAT